MVNTDHLTIHVALFDDHIITDIVLTNNNFYCQIKQNENKIHIHNYKQNNAKL